jgi:hypothetical protein
LKGSLGFVPLPLPQIYLKRDNDFATFSSPVDTEFHF